MGDLLVGDVSERGFAALAAPVRLKIGDTELVKAAFMPDLRIVIDRCRPDCVLPARDTGAGKGLAVFFHLLGHACAYAMRRVCSLRGWWAPSVTCARQFQHKSAGRQYEGESRSGTDRRSGTPR